MKKVIQGCWLGLALIIFSASSSAQAESKEVASSPNTESPSAPEAIELYQGPKILKAKNPRYPIHEQRSNEEGWVVMQYMVGASGEAYEISVVDSMGSDSFGESATRALEQFTFQPAMANGKPIDAGYHSKIVFSLQGGRQGARHKFVKRYKKLAKVISAQDKEQADLLFSELEITNLYEDAFYHFLRALYEGSWGTPREQFQAIRRAMAHEESASYLAAPQYLAALRMRFRLEVELRHFVAASASAAQLVELETDPQRIAAAYKAAADISAFRDSEQAYKVEGNLGDHTSAWHKLFRNRFQVDLVEGKLAELKLRCRKSYLFFRYDPELEYSVKEDHMPCTLEVLGDPGTSFTILQ